ncbi:MAG: hemolysin family protein [candidate division Zixibacteria bacterium]|nr:hemolysin family protein [candidate division Zixibacteria bacterium]
METDLLLQLLAILVLILANGFFSLSEFSIIASRPSRLKQQISEGRKGASRAEKLRRSPDRFLATIQVGITLVGTMAGVFGGATLVEPLQAALSGIPVELIADAAQPVAVGIVAVLITVFAVILGELVPKYIALSNPERYACLMSSPITVFTTLIGFVSISLSGAAHIILRLLGIKSGRTGGVVTEDEINLMILEGRKKGVFDDTEEQLIKSVFDFADSTVRRAMTPRPDVIALTVTTPPDDIITKIISSGHSKYPVYENSIDNIVGVLYTRDIIHQKMNPKLIVLNDIIRKPIFVPDSMPLPRLLREFQRKKKEFAIVLDEFGGTAGIVTLEDIMEELVGEIRDEDDDRDDPLVKHSETVAYADGSVWPGAINELMDCHLPEAESDTLAGLIIDHLGRLPEQREVITLADMKITVLKQDNIRLTRMMLERLNTPADGMES